MLGLKKCILPSELILKDRRLTEKIMGIYFYSIVIFTITLGLGKTCILELQQHKWILLVSWVSTPTPFDFLE
jgi:hypothetical protein